MPYKKAPCPECGKPKTRFAKLCRQCSEPYERTPEHRKALSEKLKGRQQRGAGWHHSKATKKKMASHWTPKRKAAKSLEQKLYYENYDNRMAIALKLAGENNPNYQGKNGANNYAPGYGQKYARVLRKEKGKCEKCGKINCCLHLHHKDFGTTNHLPENLQCLCVPCHRKVHAEHKRLLRKSSPA